MNIMRTMTTWLMLVYSTTQRVSIFGEDELPEFERKNHSSKLRVTDSGELFRGNEPKNPNLLVFEFFGGCTALEQTESSQVYSCNTPEGKS